MSDNWVVQHLINTLDTWNEKLAEVWRLLTLSPENFKGGGIWNVILQINGALQAIGLALLVLFFLAGVVKTSANLGEIKRPEHALKLFLRFAIAKGVVTYGLELMMAIFTIVQGVISKIMVTSGVAGASKTTLPQEMIDAIEDCGFFESIPLWAVTLIGSLFVTVLSFIIILTVYGRFFKIFMYTAIAPIPLSTERVRGCLPGGRDHCAGLHHIQPVRIQSACCGSGRGACGNGLEVYRRTGIQHAGACRHRQNE